MEEEKKSRLRQRANGHWYIATPGGGRGKSTRTRDVYKAQAIHRRWQDAHKQDATGTSAGLTIHAALDDFLSEHVEPKTVSWRQAKIMAGYFKAHFTADRLVSSVREEDIDEPGGNGYIQKRRECRLVLMKANPVPASDGSLRREIGFLAAAFQHATRKRDRLGLPRLLKTAVPHLPMPKMPPPRDRYLTREEENTLVAACQVEWPAKEDKPARLTRIYRFLMLALHTAARKEAIETLMWTQIDFGTGSIDLNPVGRRQTSKRRAVVRMSGQLRRVLERAFQERTGPFVLDHEGDIRKLFEALVAKSGLPDVTPHTLRHTWATRAAQAGVPMREIADWLGDNIATVERNYYKRSPHYLKDAIDWRERENSHEGR